MDYNGYIILQFCIKSKQITFGVLVIHKYGLRSIVSNFLKVCTNTKYLVILPRLKNKRNFYIFLMPFSLIRFRYCAVLMRIVETR